MATVKRRRKKKSAAPIVAVLLLIAILTVICNLLSDIVIAILDPRIRIAIGGGDK